MVLIGLGKHGDSGAENLFWDNNCARGMQSFCCVQSLPVMGI
jgi:hypothetical protein